MASVTVNLTGYSEFSTGIQWPDDVSLGPTFAANDMTQTLAFTNMRWGGGTPGRVVLAIDGDNNRFTPAFEATGRIIYESSDGETLEIMIANADMTEAYDWIPTNSAEVIAFTNHVRGLTDQTATLTLTDDPPGPVNVAPSFADDTGNAQSWTQNSAIQNITVPEADGDPTPTYAVVGNLPAGIAFNTGTRVISGTPTATGSGTITIRATNSEGDADWTVDYTTSAPASAPSRPVAPTLTVDSDSQITAVGVAPNNGGDTITSYDWRYRETSPLGPWIDRLNQTSLTQTFSGLDAAQGYRFQFRATNSVGDSSYSPSANATTDAAPVAPTFADDTGNAQTWIVDASIANITVPAATGSPSPTYARVGSLPDGIAFNVNTRVISGTPTETGNGTIRIRATNSAGFDDWTVTYTTNAPPIVHTAPSFADDTGDAQTWITGQGIFAITVPTASGVPTPMYFSVGALPAGLSFNMNTRVISGAPSTAGSGTITIRASNSEGSDDWTLAYTITDPPPEPVTGTMTYTVIDDDGNPVSIDIPWTVNP